MEQYVITISRQFGSMGRSIARELSEILGIEFLDRDIVEATAKRMGLPVSVISDEEESMKSTFFRRQYPLGMGMSSLKDEIFLTQKNIIRDFAAKGSCIIVGRCADYILEDIPNHLNVYVYAPDEARLKNCVENLRRLPGKRYGHRSGYPGSSQSDTGEDRHYDLQRRSSEKHHGIWYSAGA